MTRHVIIGLGVAGASAAEEIRKRDPLASITIINGEKRPFYFRPALSWLLKGKISEMEIAAKPADWARKRGFTIVNGNAVSVMPDEGAVLTGDGVKISYDRLLIASGAQAITPPWPGINLKGVFTYRTLDDALAIAEGVKESQNKKAVVIGGEILGVELAEILIHLGFTVTLAAREDRVLSLIFDETASSIVQRRMESTGVKLTLNAAVNSLAGEGGRVREVELESGEKLAGYVVLVAVGVRPVTGFLDGSGLTENGRLAVNENMETGVKGVYAAGDAVVRKTGDGFMPCRTWLDAAEQGKTAGANMAGAGLVYNNDRTFFNASTVFGRFYAVIGRFNAPEGGGTQSRVLSGPGGAYMKIITENGRIIGGTCFDDVRAALAVRRAVLENRKLAEFGNSPSAIMESLMPYSLF